MVDYADLGIELPRNARGRDVKTFCPECRDQRTNKRDRSLSVNLDEGCWKCHYCGWSDYLENHNRTSPSGTWRPPMRPAPAPPPPPPVAPSSPLVTGRAATFLADRELPGDVADKYGLWGDDAGIHIPYVDAGRVINIKHRWFDGDNTKAGHSMEAGQPLIFWGLDHCRGQNTIAIAEGEWDAMAITMAGIPALSVPNGGTKGKANLSYVDAAADLLEATPSILICTDTDDVGGNLEQELVRRIGIEKCKRVTWSVGKDANDVLMLLGMDALRRDLAAAIEYPIEGVVRPASLTDQLRSLYHEGLSRGHSTGLDSVDALYTILPGYITMVTGMPGSGKSELLDQVIINTGMDLGWKWAVFSPEGDPREEHLSRLIEKLSGLPFFDGPSTRMSWELAERAVDWVDEHVTFLDPDEPTLDEILEKARIEVLRRGINCLIIDPWNEVIHEQRPNELISDYISRTLRVVRRWAERTRTHVFIVNHPHQMAIDQRTGQYPLVREYDVNGGAMWANKCGAILSLWRDRLDGSNPVELHVLKTKTRRIGQRGKAYLTYDRVTGRFSSNGRSAYELAG